MSRPDLRCGDWRHVLADVATCDALICDPPYGERTHRGHNAGVQLAPDGMGYDREINYAHWTPDDVRAFVEHWSPRTKGWMCCFSCSDLDGVWREEFERAGRYAFGPVPCITIGGGVRMRGDGPSNWTVLLNVARPRTKEYAGWGTTPAWYLVPKEAGKHIGGKPIKLMDAIVGDYSRPGDVVVDPCAGYATTLISAARNHRRGLGCEIDPETFEHGVERLAGLPDDDGLPSAVGPRTRKDQLALFGGAA